MRQSDDDGFTAFVTANSATLFRTAYLMTGDYQRAEDLLQTTLVRVYQRWPRVEAMERPVAYARKVLVNQSTSWWRRRSSHETPVFGREDGAWDGRLDDVAEHERVWAAVLSLPPRQRAVTVLKYYEDLSEAEIAATLDMAPGTVKSHTHGAARRLAVLLAEPAEPADLPARPGGPAQEVAP
ncbi:MAG TPA: SigE family RNA polymerase sigma factor [Ornithinibacter sp.]|nr:SigE family RNA polymerase sigma factor [Ornithinibacter sp.]